MSLSAFCLLLAVVVVQQSAAGSSKTAAQQLRACETYEVCVTMKDRAFAPACQCSGNLQCILGEDEATGFGRIHYCRDPSAVADYYEDDAVMLQQLLPNKRPHPIKRTLQELSKLFRSDKTGKRGLLTK